MNKTKPQKPIFPFRIPQELWSHIDWLNSRSRARREMVNTAMAFVHAQAEEDAAKWEIFWRRMSEEYGLPNKRQLVLNGRMIEELIEKDSAFPSPPSEISVKNKPEEQ